MNGVSDRHAFWTGCSFSIFAALIWGVQAVVSRQSVADGLTAGDVTMLRFLVAAIAFFPVVARMRPFPAGGLGWRRAAVLTAVAGAPYSLVLVGGAAFAPAFHCAVILPSVVLLVGAVLSFWFCGERPTPNRTAGLLVIATSIVVFSWDTLQNTPTHEESWRGDLLFVVAAIMWGSFGFLLKRWSLDPISTAAIISFLSLMSLPAWIGIVPSSLSQSALAAILFQAFYQGLLVGALALYAYIRAIALIGPLNASLFTASVPLVTAVAGMAIGEWPTHLEMAGGLGVVGGMVMALRSARSQG